MNAYYTNHTSINVNEPIKGYLFPFLYILHQNIIQRHLMQFSTQIIDRNVITYICKIYVYDRLLIPTINRHCRSETRRLGNEPPLSREGYSD